jgi:ubiquinone biosynthesis protein Coq4
MTDTFPQQGQQHVPDMQFSLLSSLYYIMRQLHDSHDVYHSVYVTSFTDKQG